MELVIGGVGQGKQAYVQKKYGYSKKEMFRSPSGRRNEPVFAHLEQWVKESLSAGQDPAKELEALLLSGFDGVILCDEVGCGVVPAVAEDRLWRETVGRLCCRLAQQADTVTRIFCGLPMSLKAPHKEA